MKNSRTIALSLLAALLCSYTVFASGLDGKYEKSESEKNATNTHSHFSTTNLLIVHESAVLFRTDNGDIGGGKKERLKISPNPSGADLLYDGCITQYVPDDPEEACSPTKPLGKKLYTLVPLNGGGGLILKELMQKDVVFKKVSKFSFE